MTITHLVYVKPTGEKEPVTSFDIQQMRASLQSGTVTVPRGLTPEQLRKWLREMENK